MMNPTYIAIYVAIFATSVFGDHDYRCPQPEVPTYGYISKGRKTHYEEGNEIEYACRYGYTMSGKKAIKCVSKDLVGYWDPPAPECKKGNRM